MSDELAVHEPEKSVFTTLPEQRHDYGTREGREEASVEINRMFGRFWGIMDEGEGDTYAYAVKIELLDQAIATLTEKRKRLESELVEARKPYFARAVTRLRQVLHHKRKVHEHLSKVPATLKLPAGEVRVTKRGGGVKVEWESDDDVVSALDAADLPFEVAEQVVRTLRVPDKAWLNKHLVEHDGAQYVAWTDADGVVQEREVCVKRTAPGDSVSRNPIRRETPVPESQRVQVRRTSDDEWQDVSIEPARGLPEHEEDEDGSA